MHHFMPARVPKERKNNNIKVHKNHIKYVTLNIVICQVYYQKYNRL